jgi:acetyl esterase/lipase
VYNLLVVLAFTSPPPEREIYFRHSVWHQYAELPAGQKVTVVGHSAGAHAAAMLAFDPANKGRIKKLKLMSGVYQIGPFVRLVTIGPWSKPRRAFRGISSWECSPLFNIPTADKDSPAFEIYYASHDLPGLKRQAETFYDALISNGYTASLDEVPATHRSIAWKLGY